MEDLMSVSQVSKECGVTTRMLRYYEKAGLISSTRITDYAYRMYSKEDVDRIKSSFWLENYVYLSKTLLLSFRIRSIPRSLKYCKKIYLK